jgi:hypothetical protein
MGKAGGMSASVKPFFVSALSRRNGSAGPDETPRRREPSAAQLAMMTADQLRDYYRRRGEWQSADLEAIAEARKQNGYISNTRVSEGRQ